MKIWWTHLGNWLSPSRTRTWNLNVINIVGWRVTLYRHSPMPLSSPHNAFIILFSTMLRSFKVIKTMAPLRKHRLSRIHKLCACAIDLWINKYLLIFQQTDHGSTKHYAPEVWIQTILIILPTTRNTDAWVGSGIIWPPHWIADPSKSL